VTTDSVRRFEDLGVDDDAGLRMLYRGEPYSPVAKKKDSMSRFADKFIN